MDQTEKPRVRHVYVCLNTDCVKRGNEFIHRELQQKLAGREDVQIHEYICFGNCDNGANVVVYPQKVWMNGLRKDDASVVMDYLLHGKVPPPRGDGVDDELATTIYEMLELEFAPSLKPRAEPSVAVSPNVEPNTEPTQLEGRPAIHTIGTYQPHLLVRGTARCETINEYESRGGYQALHRVVKSNDPQKVISVITHSGLTGKGGANYPTGKKWQMVCEATEATRYVVSNGGEHEPGSRKDRMLLECYPHSVLEGTLIAAHTVGARTAYIYVTEDQEQAISNIDAAISEARERGHLDIETDAGQFSCEVVCFPAPATYVAGEETAALNAIEGEDPRPRAKPPYPTVAGLFGKPTLVNNVETLATVPLILNRGAVWYRRRGTLESPGWVLVTLGQEVNRPGVYEVPHGMTLRKLIFDYSGGPVGGKGIKAILPGGPSLPFLRATDLDVPIDHESLKIAGSGIGCGAIRIWLEDSCMVEATLRVAEFFAREQCGLCPPCCMETNSFVKILSELAAGHRGPSFRAQIDKAVDFARGKGRCSLIKMASAPVLSALSLFEEDFSYHVEHGRCRFDH